MFLFYMIVTFLNINNQLYNHVLVSSYNKGPFTHELEWERFDFWVVGIKFVGLRNQTNRFGREALEQMSWVWKNISLQSP